jgi:Cu-Zn family superoxide dismutase
MKHVLVGVLVLGAGSLGLSAQTPAAGKAAAGTAMAAAGAKATVKLAPTANQTARGEVTFTAGPDGVHVVGTFSGLVYGEHGFHVHEKGDCSAPDGASAGGHFNPAGKPHASREADARHAGDLGNIKADPYGLARVDFVDKTLSLSGPESIVGKAVIVHEKVDDYTTQPSGNAGARQACGVIEAAK